MAKIVLVSKKVTPTAWQLAQALRAQQHEVVLLTSYGETPDDTSGIEFMAYFKKWNFIEGLRIIPGLFGLRPQILHLLLEEDRMNPAQVLLSAFAKSHPTCVLTTSLLHIRHGLTLKNPVRYLVEESDIITCPTVESLGQLRGLDIRSNRQGRGILPPVLDLKNQDQSDLFQEESELQLLERLRGRKFIVIPFNESYFAPESEAFERLRTVAQKYPVALWGSYAHWSLRDRKRFATWMREFQCKDQWVVTGPLSASAGERLLAESTGLLLAGQSFTPVEMTEYYMRAIRTHATLILDSKQTGLHSDLWKNGVNCWVLDHAQQQKDLIKLLAKSRLHLPETLSERLAQDRHMMDSSMNELNRLYNRALNHLR